jgi:hypothetical protein
MLTQSCGIIHTLSILFHSFSLTMLGYSRFNQSNRLISLGDPRVDWYHCIIQWYKHSLIPAIRCTHSCWDFINPHTLCGFSWLNSWWSILTCFQPFSSKHHSLLQIPFRSHKLCGRTLVTCDHSSSSVVSPHWVFIEWSFEHWLQDGTDQWKPDDVAYSLKNLKLIQTVKREQFWLCHPRTRWIFSRIILQHDLIWLHCLPDEKSILTTSERSKNTHQRVLFIELIGSMDITVPRAMM